MIDFSQIGEQWPLLAIVLAVAAGMAAYMNNIVSKQLAEWRTIVAQERQQFEARNEAEAKREAEWAALLREERKNCQRAYDAFTTKTVEAMDKMARQLARNTTAIILHDAYVRGNVDAEAKTPADLTDKILNT